jgi:ATP-binding cassette subfamily C (CFTR/MRP) protein 4
MECFQRSDATEFSCSKFTAKAGPSICTGGGSNFSVGQRQLFHLARILLKQNKIIIFDKASAKIDKEIVAAQIQNVIHQVLKDHTVIIISHRRNTTKKCDRIGVLR